MAEMRTYSVAINWNVRDREQGTYGVCVRATSEAEAEAKVVIADLDAGPPPAEGVERCAP